MTLPPLSSAGLDERRRRALFRSRHRGLRELDLLLGQFSDAHLARLSEDELGDYERLMDVPDDEVFSWFTGVAPIPSEFKTPLLEKLMEFHRHAGPLHAAETDDQPNTGHGPRSV